MTLFQNNFSQKTTALILIVCLVGSIAGPVLFLPRKTQAQCTVNVAADATEVVHIGLQSVWEAIKSVWRAGTLMENIIQTATLLWDKAQQLLEWTLGVLLNLLLHQILAQLTNDIVNWIQNGGTPRFMSEGLSDYLWGAADNALGNFIDNYLGYGWLCEPFDLNIKVALLDVPTFDESVRCSLSDIVANIDAFYGDFSVGGWKGWTSLTSPQNNFYGAVLLAQGERDKQMTEAEKQVEADAQMGSGFLGMKECKWYDKTGAFIEKQEDVRGVPQLPAACRPNSAGLTPGVVRPCSPRCQTLTPGSVINEATNKAITNYWDKANAQIAAATANAGPYQVYVQAIIDALINRVITKGIGLLQADPESAPEQGGLGASEGIPDIENPESAMQNQASANSAISQLELLKDNLNNLLTEQQNNLAVLKNIRSEYQDIVAILDNMIGLGDPVDLANLDCNSLLSGNCQNQCALGQAEIIWAQNQIDHINNNLIAPLNSRINALQNNISETVSLINDTNTAIFLTEDFVAKVDAYLLAWEAAGGLADDPDLIAAKTVMNDAKTLAIQNIQPIVQTINGTTYSNDFAGLNEEIQTANINIVQETINLTIQRGYPDYPEPGTLYAELETAQDYKDDIQTEVNIRSSIINSAVTYLQNNCGL